MGVPGSTTVDMSVRGSVEVQRDAAIAWVTLCNPSRANALTVEMLGQLEEAWRAIERSKAIRAVVLMGEGNRHFCAGADVEEIASGEMERAGQFRFLPSDLPVTKPLVVAVNGDVVGGGLAFLAEGDVVLALDNVTLVDTHLEVGAQPIRTARSLARRLPGSEMSLLLAGGSRAPMSADRAHALGLFQQLIDDVETLEGRARELAQRLGGMPSELLLSLRQGLRHT
jgi:E-phenylitaconyl-CoA hydratase